VSENLPVSADDLSTIAKDIGKKSSREHALNLIRAAFSTAPFGGGIASLMFDYIPTQQANRWQAFAESVAEGFKKVESKLDESYIQTDEFAYLIQRIFVNVGREYQKEKLDAYRNMLVNALRVDTPASIQEGYLNKIETLTPLHIRMILAVVGVGVRRKTGHIDIDLDGQPVEFLGTLLPDFPREMVMPCAHDLDSQGITDGLEDQLEIGSGFIHFNSHLALTDYGRGLLKFIVERD
jgi:hypothetical protein